MEGGAEVVGDELVVDDELVAAEGSVGVVVAGNVVGVVEEVVVVKNPGPIAPAIVVTLS